MGRNHKPTTGEKFAGATAHSGIFARFTLRSLAANRVRTAVTIVGIALATGLLTAVFSSVTSLQKGMLQKTMEIDGVWQASASGLAQQDVDAIREALGDHLDRLATRRDLGSAALSAANWDDLGGSAYVNIVTTLTEAEGTPHAAGDDDYPVSTEGTVYSGRLPEKAGEIALPTMLNGATLTGGASLLDGVESGISSDGPIQIGSTITLAVGRRHDGGESLGARSYVRYRWQVDPTVPYDAADANDVLETLDDVEVRTFTVVGFVNSVDYLWSAAFVSPDEPAFACGDLTDVWVSTTGYDSASLIDQTVEGALGEKAETAGVILNTSLLMQQGFTDMGRAIVGTLYLFAGTLAVVIIVAAVSLISNAFTISVSERTRQFGLLSSLGASKRQLRRTVLVEAAVLGVAGIPLGVGLGLLGALIAFQLTGEGWAALVGTSTNVGLSVEPGVIVLSVAVSCVTLAVSAFIPALRASRVSAVDAIRQTQDVRPNRRLARIFRARSRKGPMADFTADGRRPTGLAARVAGIPGFLARRTLQVSASKSRVAVTSLAVSVALLVTAGVTGDYLDRMVGEIDYYPSADLEVDVASDIAEDGTTTTQLAGLANELVEKARGVEGVTSASIVGRTSAYLNFEEGALDLDELENYRKIVGDVSTNSGTIFLADDATWRSIVQNLPQMSSEYADPSRLSCVVYNSVGINTGTRYGSVHPFTNAAGTEVEVCSLTLPDSYSYTEWVSGDGEHVYRSNEDGTDSDLGLIDDYLTTVESVPVAAVTEDLGDSFPLGQAALAQSGPVIVMPASAVAQSGISETFDSYGTLSCYATLSPASSSADVLEELREALSTHEGASVSGWTNLAETMRQQRAMSFTVQVFLYCFAAITGAIAVANVFNTIASSMMRRTREFAVLRSAGMGGRAFRRMIVLECADLAVKGLLLGFVLSMLIDLQLMTAMVSSFADIVFVLPVGHLILAFGVVTAVLAASTIYALRKTHAMNLVEALRADTL